MARGLDFARSAALIERRSNAATRLPRGTPREKTEERTRRDRGESFGRDKGACMIESRTRGRGISIFTLEFLE